VGALGPPSASLSSEHRPARYIRQAGANTMSLFDVEDQINQAREAGQFDDLPGKGKPFTHLNSDPFDHLLQEQGFVPHWLELEYEIRAKVEIAHQSVKRTYEWVMQTWSAGSIDRVYARDEWQKARHTFAQRLDEINALIRTFNLELPEPLRHLQRFPLQPDEELPRLGLTNVFD
jgi:hypothetical protein